MRSKKVFSFNEEKDAEMIIENGFKNNLIDYSEMYVVAKYFRETFSYGEVRLERELIKFSKKHDINFNPVVEAVQIKKWVKSAMKYGLRSPSEIYLSQKEIEFLKTIKNPKDRKLLFIILVFAKTPKGSRKSDSGDLKLYPLRRFYLHYRNLSDIIKISKFTGMTDIKLCQIIGKYKNSFEILSPERQLIMLKYTFPERDIPITIKHNNDILKYYDLLMSEKDEKKEPTTFNCKRCGRETKKIKNNQKYCPLCASNLKKERDRERIRRKRSKK